MCEKPPALLAGFRSTGIIPLDNARKVVHLQCPGDVAQLVEHQTENLGVGGSSPPVTTR